MSSEQKNLGIVKAFFGAIERGGDASALMSYYSEDVIQEEFPNAFLPQGARRDLEALSQASARGRKVMASQTWEIISALASGDTVVVEAAWTGTLAVPLDAKTPAGSVMRARFAQFFRLRDGKIVSQRNYDCFYPWGTDG